MVTANPIKTVLNTGLDFLKALRKKKVESVVGIDIGSSSIKVVQLKNEGGRAVLETYGALALGLYADLEVGAVTNLPADKLAEALISLMEEAGVTTKDSQLSISATASLIFLIELPPQVKKSEFASVIPTEARKYIPVPISEVSLDWFVIPKKEDLYEGAEGEEGPGAVGSKQEETETLATKTEVLVVAIPNDTIAKYRDIIKQAGLEASSLEHEVFSSIRSNFTHELSPVLLFDFGASKTKLSIVERGIVKNFHTVNRGSADITNALSRSLGIPFDKAEKMKRESGLSSMEENVVTIIKRSIDYIFSEANSVVLNYEKKYNKTIDKVLLSGGGTLLKGFPELAIENFRSEVMIGHPFAKVEAPAFLEETLKVTGPEFAVAIGLALGKL